MAKSLHSICRWTFNAGKGGFVSGDIRSAWIGGRFGTPEMIQPVADRIRPRLPRNVVLGVELHYDAEVDDNNAKEVADALVDNKLYLAMITPGAHAHFAYGGIASLDKAKRKIEEEFGVSCENKGVNKEFGHSEMIGLDHVYSTIEELDNDMTVHIHVNSQGYNEGIIRGCPGKCDIDHGVRVNSIHGRVAKDALIGVESARTIEPRRQLRCVHRDDCKSWHGTPKRTSGMVSGGALRVLASVECLGLVAALGARPGFNFDSLSLCFAVAGVSVLLIPINELAHYLRRVSRVTVRRWKRWGFTIGLAKRNARTRRRRD